MPQVRLTQRFVQSAECPAAERKVDFFDLRLSGFLLEVRASGGKTYYQRYSDAHGDQRQFRVGSSAFLTLAQAKNKARDLITSIQLGSDPQQEKAALRAIPTFREFAKETYLPFAKTYKRSWSTDETMIRVHLLPAIGHLHLDQVSHQQVYALLAKLRDGGYAPGTICRALILLRHIFNVSRKWKIYAGDNPTSGIPAPAEVQRNRFLTREEASRLILAIEQDENRVAASSILLLLLTGARRNEITHAEWEFVDWQNRTLLVPKSKNGKARWVRLNEPAMNVLRRMRREGDNPYIFPTPTTGRPSPHIFFPWDRIRKRARLPDVRLHDLRHSFASFLINDGASLYRVQRLLGHANAKSTQRYAHLSQDELAETAESLATILGLRKDERSRETDKA